MSFGMSEISRRRFLQVTGAAPTEIAPNLTVATTYKSDVLELLPVGRTLNAAVLMAPGVTDNGPSGNIMVSGAMSYENLFLINGYRDCN